MIAPFVRPQWRELGNTPGWDAFCMFTIFHWLISGNLSGIVQCRGYEKPFFCPKFGLDILIIQGAPMACSFCLLNRLMFDFHRNF